MRVVVSAVKAAPHLEEGKLRIVWQKTGNCAATFDQLFEPLEEKFFKMETGTFADRVATRKNLWLPRMLRVGKYDRQLEDFYPQANDTLLALSQKWRRLYVSTCLPLGSYEPQDVAECFRPLPKFLKRVEETAAQFSENTLGVHIRRTDNRESILHSPLRAFRKRIERFLDEEEDGKVFLCTDDGEVKSYLQKLFGPRILFRRNVLSRSSLTGMEEAVVDLWSLARTGRVVGSYYSSFSNTAAELGGQPLEIIKQEPHQP